MRIPSLAEPRSGHKLAGRHVVPFGAGTASGAGRGWSLRQEGNLVHGVGKAATLVYARHGTVVTCIDIDLDAASATVELIRREGGQPFALACNASRSDGVKETTERSLAYNRRIDVLHNNIGVARMGTVECPEDTFDEVIAVNLKSVCLTCKWALPGEGWDVGEATAYLASDEARFITGQALVVDGGGTVVMSGKPWQPSKSASV